MSTELSVEELAMQESQRAVEAEATARAAADTAPQGAADAEADAEAAKPAAAEVAAVAEETAKAAVKPDDKHDPHAAIVAFRKQNQALLAEKIRLEGMVEALKSVADKTPPAPPQEQPVDPLEAIAARRVALAEQADNGELTLAEMRKADMELEREARELEFQRLLAQTQPKASAAPDLYLEQATAQLVKDFPILTELSTADLAPFADLAYAQATREGTPIQPGALGTLDLRTRIAQLATKMYGAAPTAPVTPVANGGLDSKAAALAAKVEMQNVMPPDVNKLGVVNTEVGMTESQLNQRLNDPNLTYAESEALMRSVSPALRAKLGIT